MTTLTATSSLTVSEKLLQGQSLGFLLLKCQEALKSAGRPIKTFDLQTALMHSVSNLDLGMDYFQQLFADPAFVSILRGNARMEYDQKSRRWSFKSLYADFTSLESLLAGIEREPDGLDVTQELLDHHPQMADWLQQLLEKHAVRALRASKAVRCKNFAVDSGFVCDVYEPKSSKCDNCAVLRGLILYDRHGKDYQLDEDLKETWSGISIPAMEAILDEMKVKNQLSQLERYPWKSTVLQCMSFSKRKPRRRAPGRLASDPTFQGQFGMTGRVNKVANAHIYTMEELKAELVKPNG